MKNISWCPCLKVRVNFIPRRNYAVHFTVLAVIIINQLRCTFYAHPPPPRYSVKLLERLLRPALVTALPPHATRPILMIDGYYLTYSHTPATWRIKIRQHKVSNRLLRQRIDGYSDCCCQNSAVHGPGSHRARVTWYSRLCRRTGRSKRRLYEGS